MKKRIIDMTWSESPVWMNIFGGTLAVLFIVMLILKSKVLCGLWFVGVVAWLFTLAFAPKIEVRKKGR